MSAGPPSAAGIPPPVDNDADDVVWALQTAAVQWKLGSFEEALVWLRRAVDAAIDAGQPERAAQINRLESSLSEQIAAGAAAQNPFVQPAGKRVPSPFGAPLPGRPELMSATDEEPTPVRPNAVSELDELPSRDVSLLPYEIEDISDDIPVSRGTPAIEHVRDVFDDAGPASIDVEALSEDVEVQDITEEPTERHMLSPVSTPAPPPRRPPPPPRSSVAAPARPSAPPRASTPSRTAAPPRSSAPGRPSVSAPPRAGGAPSPSPSAPPRGSTRPLPKPPPRRTSEPEPEAPDAITEPPGAQTERSMLRAEPATVNAPAPEPTPLPPEPTTLPPESTPEPAVVTSAPPEAAPTPEVDAEPKPQGPLRIASEMPPSILPIVGADETDRPSPPSGEPGWGDVALADVQGLQDLPDDAQAELVRKARIERLNTEDEVSAFAVALVLEGWVNIMPTVADAACARAGKGEVVFTQGTLQDHVAMRVVAGQDDTRVAVWDKALLDQATRACPWVADELRVVADRFQALAGACMGPMGDRLDDSLRGMVTDRCKVRTLLPGEVIVQAKHVVPGLFIVGSGTLEVVTEGDRVSEELASGDFVFAAQVMSAGAAPATVRAGAGGALVLFADRRTAHELMMSVPPLLEILAS
jgi:hypothetical protein